MFASGESVRRSISGRHVSMEEVKSNLSGAGGSESRRESGQPLGWGTR